MTKRIIAILMAALLVLALVGCSSSSGTTSGSASGTGSGASAPTTTADNKLTMGTGGESGTYYAFGGVLGSYIGQNTDVSINVVSSGGSAANITGIVVDKTYDLATVQSDVMTYAYNGTNSFADTGAQNNFRVLGALCRRLGSLPGAGHGVRQGGDGLGNHIHLLRGHRLRQGPRPADHRDDGVVFCLPILRPGVEEDPGVDLPPGEEHPVGDAHPACVSDGGGAGSVALVPEVHLVGAGELQVGKNKELPVVPLVERRRGGLRLAPKGGHGDVTLLHSPPPLQSRRREAAPPVRRGRWSPEASSAAAG